MNTTPNRASRSKVRRRTAKASWLTGNGTLIAHDLLEHVNGRQHIGRVWDELEALGAIWQVRGRHGDLALKRSSMHSPQTNVASDVSRMFIEWGADGMPPRAHRLKRTRPHDYDEDFKDIIAKARTDIMREADEDERGREAFLADVQAYLGEALHRMRTGFRKAERKYGSDFKGYEMFVRIRDALEGTKPEYEGQPFTLAYSDERAYVQEVYDREFYS
jgi:hypothetical protein